ncbi:uncharacterized protein IL334_002884 [Kwoniella shivajii]|uniref:AMP-activated protein kinase glycogen-binding domain-containing protein n=1 Tax=Kwoniella shivajii TaxID=564305 RepID=A0ABZ1CVZ4_9TREE|nr:hypothetical protein IL334_002884 [Kwoniella shivajii]
MSHNDKHSATFAWGAGAQSVHIAGNFNEWSATATPLKKQPDGSFTAQVPLPWGEKQAFKYVVDGEWKVREDEAKEWDAAGNMNNVYTAPPAPISHSQSSASPSAVAAKTPTPAPASSEKTAHPTEKDQPSALNNSGPVRSAVPASNIPDTPAPTATKTEPSTLIASSAPGSALGPPILGGAVFPSSPKTKNTHHTDFETTSSSPTTATATTTSERVVSAPAPVPVAAPASVPAATTTTSTLDTHHQKAVPASKPLADEPISVQIEKVAKQANIGEAPAPGTEEQGIAEKASEFAAGALAAIGAVVGNAAVAVENLTGVDLAHTAPLSVEEAKAQGIDVRSLNKTDAPTDTVAPVGTAPSASAVDALQEKVDELKLNTASTSTTANTSNGNSRVADVPLPKTAEPKTSLPPPGTVNLNHKEPESKPKHDVPAQHETKANHQTVPQPIITTVSDKDPKKDRTAASTSLDDTAGTKPTSPNPGVSAKREKDIAERDPVRTAAASDSPLSEPKIAPNAPTSNVKSDKDNTSNNVDKITPSPQAKSNAAPAPTPAVAPSTSAPTPAAAPATPAKTAPITPAKDIGTPASTTSTPATTPAKSAHVKDQTTDSDMKKKKNNIFGKIKHAFSPKDKSK